MTKRILAMMLAVIMVMSLLPATMAVEYGAGSGDSYTYMLFLNVDDILHPGKTIVNQDTAEDATDIAKIHELTGDRRWDNPSEMSYHASVTAVGQNQGLEGSGNYWSRRIGTEHEGVSVGTNGVWKVFKIDGFNAAGILPAGEFLRVHVAPAYKVTVDDVDMGYYAVGETVDLNLAKEDHVIDDVNVNVSGLVIYNNESFVMPNSEVNITVTYKELFDVKFETELGTTPEAQEVADGDFAKEPADLSVEGYTFLGWYLDDAETAFDFENTAITDDITLTAKWEAEEYEITYQIYKNGSETPVEGTFAYTYGDDFMATLSAAIDVASQKNKHAVRYEFDGWYLNNALVTEDTMPISNITVEGYFYDFFRVNYFINGELDHSDEISSKNLAEYELPSYSKHYNFDGWYQASKDIGNPNKRTAKLTVLKKTDLYATLSEVEYKVNFHVLNAEGEEIDGYSDTVTISTWEEYRNSIENFEKEGYTFDGWYEKAADIGNENKREPLPLNPLKKWELYGKLTANEYTVTLDANGGEVSPETITVTFDSAYGELPKATLTGYTFNGWYDENGNKVTADTIVKTAEDHELTAQWTANTYAVKFDKNETKATGEMADQGFTYDEAQNLTANAYAWTNHIFMGWATTSDGEVVYADEAEVLNLTAEDGATVTLYAVWAEDYNHNNIDDSTEPHYDIIYTDGVKGRKIFKDQVYEDVLVGMPTPKFVGRMNYAGFAFAGWKPCWSNTVTGDVVYVAQWKQTYFQVDKPTKPAPAPAPTHDCASADYIDLDTTMWYHEATDYVLDNGLMQGTGNKMFSPYMTTTRGMIVTILHRLEGMPAAKGANPFSDVDESKWYAEAVLWAAENGIVLGYDGKFSPEDEITAEQLMLILQRYAEYKGLTESDLAVPVLAPYEYNTWAEAGVTWAYIRGILEIGTSIDDLTAPATRVELAAYLYNFCTAILEK